MNQRVSRDEVRAALTGSVTSVKIPFQRDGSIDLVGLRSYIDAEMEPLRAFYRAHGWL